MNTNNVFFNKNTLQKIKSKESEPKIIKDFLSIDEANKLLSIEKNSKNYFVLRQDRRKRSLSKDGSSTDRDYNKWDDFIKNILLPKLKQHLGDFQIAPAEFPPHFFTVIYPTRLHADTVRDPEMCVGKQLMIPLEILPKNSNAHTILFKDRWYGPTSNFVHKQDQGNFTAIKNTKNELCFVQNIIDFSKVLEKNLANKTFLFNDNEFEVSQKLIREVDDIKKKERYNSTTNKHIKNNHKIDNEFHQKYLTHHNIEDFNSLTPGIVYKWKIGEALIWDRTQLQCSDAYGKFGSKSKTAIAIFTNYK